MKLESDKRVACDGSCSECPRCPLCCISAMLGIVEVLVHGGHG